MTLEKASLVHSQTESNSFQFQTPAGMSC